MAAGKLSVTRADPVTPQLDLTSAMPVAGDGPAEIWLDSGSIEVLADQGTVCLTLQHRLAGEAWALRGTGEMQVAYPRAKA